MKKLFLLLMLGIGVLSTSCEKEPFLEYELPNLGNSLEFTADGGSIYVDITAECSYEILCKDNWVSYIETYSGIAVTAQANLETNIRESEIRILYYHRKDQIYKSIKVKQAAFNPKLEIDKTELNYDVNGGSKTIYVTTNAEFNFSESSDWISCTKSSNSVKITATASTVADVRSANVKIYLPKYDLFKNVKVTQKQFEPVLEVEDISTLHFNCSGGFKSISVTANFDYEVSSNKGWLTCTKEWSDHISIKIAKTYEVKDENREAILTIGSSKYNYPTKTIIVSQSYIPTTASTIEYRVVNDTGTVDVNPSAFDATILYNTYENGVGKIVFDKPITIIGKLPFARVSGNYAVDASPRLTSITIPKSVTKIESSFSNCDNIANVKISDLSAWCKIDFDSPYANPLCNGAGLHLNNVNVTELAIPSDIAEIKKYAFYNCRSLTSVTIPDSVTSIGSYAFEGCSRLTSVTIGNGVTDIGTSTFKGCSNLKSVIIGNGVTDIGTSTFKGCSRLTSVTIPDSIASIGNSVFYDCSSLTSVTIPNSVTSIGNDAFSNCSRLTSITIGNSVTLIGCSTFSGCSNLISITIPDSVTEIGYKAFYNCSRLTSIYCKPIQPPTLGYYRASGQETAYGPFQDSYELKIFVPRDSYNIYTQYNGYYATEGWSYNVRYWGNYKSNIEPYDFEE